MEIAAWPAWVIDLLDTFLAREPSEGDRIEIALARQAAMWSSDDNAEATDFLPFLNAWSEEEQSGEYSKADLKVINALK